jgi:hypothetical protein
MRGVDVERIHLDSSARLSDRNSAIKEDNLDIDDRESRPPEQWGDREWGEFLKRLPQGRTDGRFRNALDTYGDLIGKGL